MTSTDQQGASLAQTPDLSTLKGRVWVPAKEPPIGSRLSPEDKAALDRIADRLDKIEALLCGHGTDIFSRDRRRAAAR